MKRQPVTGKGWRCYLDGCKGRWQGVPEGTTPREAWQQHVWDVHSMRTYT